MTKVCVVIPLMNEENAVDHLLQRLTKVVASRDEAFELVLVDDGSTDATAEKIVLWQENMPNLTLVKLSRNWGHQNAYNAGLDVAMSQNPDAVVLMDGDLEDPPELIPDLIGKWREGNDVVFTVKRRRESKGVRRLLTSLYYLLMRTFGEIKIERQAGMFSLLNRKAAEHLQRFMERNKSYPNLRAFLGFRQARLVYDRQRRFDGEPKQTLRKLIRDGFNALFSFSYAPLRLMSFASVALTAILLIMFLFVLILWMFNLEFWIFRQVPGWTSAILLVMLISSFNMIFLAVLAEYVTRIFDEVRNRPYYIIDAVIRNGEITRRE